jgi:hypothetical protein
MALGKKRPPEEEPKGKTNSVVKGRKTQRKGTSTGTTNGPLDAFLYQKATQNTNETSLSGNVRMK